MNWIPYSERKPEAEPKRVILVRLASGTLETFSSEFIATIKPFELDAMDITHWAEIEPPGESDQSFASKVSAELNKARNSHAPINSLHEGYAVILEELDELWEQVRLKRSERDHCSIWEELVQISAMAQRVAEDVVLKKLAEEGKAIVERELAKQKARKEGHDA